MSNPTINETINPSLLPDRPFDGQVFIDTYGVSWNYDSSKDCWIDNGKLPNLPLADGNTTGLLSKDLKKLLNSIPSKGGHFGLIVKPLLSARPFNVTALFSDKVLRKAIDKYGSVIYGEKPFILDNNGKYNSYVKSSMAGLLLEFTTGKLKGKQFQIFDNDDGRIYVNGDLTSVAVGDSFSLYDSVEINPNGVLSGKIELVSDSIDITCVKGKDLTITTDTCNPKLQDNTTPDGLGFALKEKFLKALCLELPGCKGPKGDTGDAGEDGKPGTGDGPIGDQGDAGKDYVTLKKFAGIKVEDIDDVYDTAVVALEPDSDNGKLYVVKAKVKTPDSSTPADQVIASSIFRTVEFSEEFFFNIVRPALDPINVSSKTGIPVGNGCFIKSSYDNDVLIAAIPSGTSSDGSSEIALRWLSDLLQSIADYYREKLYDASDKYDQQIKEFITQKDQEARQAICNLAQELAECEWELPLEFCVGLTKADCEAESEVKTSFPLANSLFGTKYDENSNPKAQLVSQPFVLGGEGSHWPANPVVVRTDGKNASGREVNNYGEIIDGNATDNLPPGDYLLMWDTGALTDFEYPQFGYFVGGFLSGSQVGGTPPYGVKVKIEYPDGTVETEDFPVPDILKKPKISKTSPLGAYCTKLPLGGGPPENPNAEYFCDITPFAANPIPKWIDGAFAGYWTPGDRGEFNLVNQVPPPGTQGPGYTIQHRVPFDATEVMEAYRNAAFSQKSLTWTFSQAGGKVSLLCPILGGGKHPQFANRETTLDKCIVDNKAIRFKLYRITAL